jgi:serine/threonine protein kinase
MTDPSVGDLLDGYRLTEVVSRGGMATIFKAIDTRSGATVALKVPYLQYEIDVVSFARFEREEKIGRAVLHPNVVRVLEAGEKSRPYLVMEYVEGTPLSSILRDQGRLSSGAALDVARQVCDALACLHGEGIVHRDLKPENILMTPDGRVKILDFGIALLRSARRITWSGLSKTSGTPDYMAPEQIAGKRGDARTDVYAVGTLLYEMLTGNLPYQGESTAAVLRAKSDSEPRLPSYYVPGFDPSLEAIILKAIEPDPRHRYPGAAQLLADLRDPSRAVLRDPYVPPRRRSSAPSPWRAWIGIVGVLALLGSLVWLSARRPDPRRHVPAPPPAQTTPQR